MNKGRTLALLGFLFFLAGCEEDQIRRYSVKKPDATVKAAPSGSVAVAGSKRMLGAIVPRDAQVWFFKLDGPEAAVAEQKEAFDTFLRSVRFPGKPNPVSWTVPEGWREEKSGSSMRYATFRVGPKNLELTVIPLGKEAASVLPNVKRWRGQLGLGEIREDELGKITTQLTIDGAPATLVDMTGPGGPPGGMEKMLR